MPLDGDINFPAWSHDSKSVYGFVFDGKERWIFRVSVNEQRTERLFEDENLTGWGGFSLSLDPDDNPLVLREVGSNEIYALRFETQ
jgi:Tol biopolymer transport system component